VNKFCIIYRKIAHITLNKCAHYANKTNKTINHPLTVFKRHQHQRRFDDINRMQ